MKGKLKYIGFIFVFMLIMTLVPIFKTQATHMDYSYGSIGLDVTNDRTYSSDKIDNVYVKGWAFSDQKVTSITCDIGGVVIANLKYGMNRPDVNKKYSNCKSNKVGFAGNVPVSRIPRGKQTINIKVNLSNNKKMKLSFTLTMNKKDNRTFIDFPQNDDVKNNLAVRGWALNDSGISNIGIFIDGKWVKNTKSGVPREDVNRAFPGYVNGRKSGYSTNINVSSYKPGRHKIMVTAVGKDGSRESQERCFTIVRKPTHIAIDSPKDYTSIKNSVTVTGWSLDDSGRKAVDIYVNNRRYCSVYNVKGCWKLYRPDVNIVFPNYPQHNNSGFSRTLDTSKWKDGTYKIKFVSVGIDGTITESAEKIVIKGTKPTRSCLDEPRDGNMIKDSVNVKGWVLSDSKVKSIKVYLDNRFVKEIKYGAYRPDVNIAYPSYSTGDNPGFEEKVNISNFKNGKYTLKVVVTFENNKSITRQSVIMKGIKKTEPFETNISGSTGWVAHSCYLRKSPNENATITKTLNQGTVFRILKEQNDYWQISENGNTGWIKHQYCMINLPDVLPSIMYNITNADKSIYMSSGKSLSGITGYNLYKVGKVQNNKIGRQEYIVPLQYSVAKKVALVQRDALNSGYCLKIYDAYRPSEVSKKVKESLDALYNSDRDVASGINYSYGASGTRYEWDKGWFISQGVSAHNTGSALDVTLVNKNNKEELKMPSAMHELSTKAIKYYSANCSESPRNYSKDMTDGAKKLDSLFTNQNMNTLASEWWHFQDTNAYNEMIEYNGYKGCEFYATKIVSTPD